MIPPRTMAPSAIQYTQPPVSLVGFAVGSIVTGAVAPADRPVEICQVILPTVPAADIKVGLFPGGLAFGDGAVWVALNSPGGRVAPIDPTTNKVEKTIPVGADPVAISVGGGAVWVANSESDTVSRIDPGTERVTATVRVGKAPVDVAFGDGAVWVA